MNTHKENSINTAYLVGTNKYSFRRGEKAKILTVVLYSHGNIINRPCYKIQYKDKAFDYVVIEDTDNYIIVSENEDVSNISGFVLSDNNSLSTDAVGLSDV